MGGIEAEEEMSSRLALTLILRQNPRVAGMVRLATRATCRRRMGAKMNSVRFGSMILLTCLLVACSHHPITIAPAYVAQPAPARPLVVTPAPAVVSTPPTPELKPGTEISLELHRSEGDANAEFLAAGAAESEVARVPESGAANPPVPGSATTASTDNDPDHLVGLSEADAIRLLGNPKSRADTPPSRIWTYRSTSCDLRLFFYPEIGGTSYRTLTYEIDDHDPTDTNRRNCVGGLLKNHAS